MILKTDILQDSCKKILSAVDSNFLLAITDMLEINCKDGIFSMIVTNIEYYVEIQVPVDTMDEFHATVNAVKFLKLIEKTTSESIEFTSNDKILTVKCNGTYKIPLIYDNDKLLKLPVIDIESVSDTFEISSEKLQSIVDFNSKELLKGSVSRPVQRLYYFDANGCVTFTNGACVNDFIVDSKSNLLFTDKFVKLFKLFNANDTVFVTVGHNKINKDTVVTVIKLETNNIKISSILNCDDSLMQSYPVEAIRKRAHKDYSYSVSLNKNSLNQAIERLLIFMGDSLNVSALNLKNNTVKIKFNETGVVISDTDETNTESIEYSSNPSNIKEYEVLLNSKDFIKTLSNCTNQVINLSYGDGEAVLLKEGDIYWVLPECYLTNG